MTCQNVTMPDGGRAIVCGPTRRCKWCRRRGTLECDWKVPSRKSGTCDALMCSDHATSPAPGKDLCPDHAKAFEEWKARQ